MNGEILDKVVALRHMLHQHPELSGQERETKRMLMAFLRENSTLQLNDMGKWFYAEYHPANGKLSLIHILPSAHQRGQRPERPGCQL